MTHEPLIALLVDVGGTLVDDATWLNQDQYEAHMVSRLREAFGTDHPWFAPLASHRFVESDALTWEQRTAEVVTAMLAEHGYQASAEEVERICRACAAPLSQVVELADGALEAVRAIRNLGVRMVICSNTLWRNDADSRRDWEELGFGGYFDAYVTSHDTGFAKPHPAMFERALAAVGARPAEAAIIGDRPERDLAGARAVGMRSIWMRPPDFVGEPDPEPDAVVSGWSEVRPIIELWRTAPGEGIMMDHAAVSVRPTEVDLGVCRGVRFDRGADAWVILLPGANYSTTAPLLWFAREAALAAGRNVLAVVDSRKGSTDDPQLWVEERAEAALRHVGSGARPILVAKSITSLAAPLAARLGLSAVWLTPLISAAGAPMSQAVIDGLAGTSAPFLLIGGTADPSWDGVRARSIARGEVLEIADADHLLQVPGDGDRSIDALRSVSAAVAVFIGAIDGATNTRGASLTGIDHVQIAIPPNSEAQARDFYGSLLGMREVPKPEPLARRGGCWFVGPGIHLHLGVVDDFQPARKAHPAFRVRDLAALRDRLTSSGIAVEDDDSLSGVRRFYAADSFGNRLEFIEDADGGFTDRR